MAEKTNHGSVNHYNNPAGIELSVDKKEGAYVYFQSKRYFPRQIGKSMIILFAGILYSENSKCCIRMGLFDEYNGIYFEYINKELFLIKKSYYFNKIFEVKIKQSDWNIDTMNGKGISGINVDIKTPKLYIINIGSFGNILAGFIIDGKIYYIHKFGEDNSNNKNIISQINLPFRIEICNMGDISTAKYGNGKSYLFFISIISEGDIKINTLSFSVGRYQNISIKKNRKITSIVQPILTIKLKNNKIKNLVELVSANILNTSKNNVMYSVYQFISPKIDPLFNPDWQEYNELSNIYYDKNATLIDLTDGISVYVGYFNPGFSTTIDLRNKNLFITSDIDNNSDVFSLVSEEIEESKLNLERTLAGSFHWIEYQN